MTRWWPGFEFLRARSSRARCCSTSRDEWRQAVADRCVGPDQGAPGRRPRRHARRPAAAAAPRTAGAPPWSRRAGRHGDRRPVAESAAARACGGAAQPSVPAAPRPARRRHRVDGQRLPLVAAGDRTRRRSPPRRAQRDPADPSVLARSTRSSIDGTVPPTPNSTTSTTGAPRQCAWPNCGFAPPRSWPPSELPRAPPTTSSRSSPH